MTTYGYKFSWTEIDILRKNWKTLAEKNNGEFKTINVHSIADKNDVTSRKFELRIPFLESTIIFFSTEFKPLKISYLLHSVNFNEFLIYPEDFTDRIGKLFGLKELEIGDKIFDRSFIIKAENEEFLKRVLTTEMRNYLLQNAISNFKLEKIEEGSNLEMNLMINELENSKMIELLSIFKNCVTNIKR